MLQKLGIELDSVFIATINKKFVYLENYQELFNYKEISQQIYKLLEKVEQAFINLPKLSTTEPPKISIGNQCYKPRPCPFIDYCEDNSIAYPISTLPHAFDLINHLKTNGYHDIREVPYQYLTHPQQQMVWKAVKQQQEIIAPELIYFLKNLAYPRYFIDFESIAPTIPLWPHTSPYQGIPFQWSCYYQSDKNHYEHYYFLKTKGKIPSHAFIHSLVYTLENTKGPIFVYSPYENNVLNKLQEQYPKYQRKIKAIQDRLVDLLALVRQYYYHPQMHGSWSLKTILPIISQSLDYNQLIIKDGAMAQEVYQYLFYNEENYDYWRQALLEYCQQDTYGLMLLVDFLQSK